VLWARRERARRACKPRSRAARRSGAGLRRRRAAPSIARALRLPRAAPTRPELPSLNVSNAAAVALYELARGESRTTGR